MNVNDQQMTAQRMVMVKAIETHCANVGERQADTYMMGVIWGCIDYMITKSGRRYAYTIIQGFADGIVDKIIEKDQP